MSNAIAALRLNSAPGGDNITAEHIRYGPASLGPFLAPLYSTLFSHAIVPRLFQLGIIVPILKKPSLNANECANYRPITLCSTLAKLAELLIPLNHTPSPTQFGFREGRSTDQAVALIPDAVRTSNHDGKPVFIATLDAEKCFDRIWHDGLFRKLHGLVPPSLWLFLVHWYRSLYAAVRWKGDLSKEFAVTRGTRQGSLLSPALFNLFIDDLLKDLQSSQIGLSINGLCTNCVAYADDITLLASTVPDLQRLIDLCHNYALRWLFSYGAKKSACLIAGPHRFTRVPEWHLGSHRITVVDEMSILGVSFTSNWSSSLHVATRSIKCNRAFYGLSRAGILSPGLSPDVKSRLWNSVCRPTLLYGCAALDVSKRDLKRLESEQGSLVKRSLRIGKRSHHSALLRAMNIPSVEADLTRQTAGLVDRILAKPSPCRDLYILELSRRLAGVSSVPGTLVHRASSCGVSVINPLPLRPAAATGDGLVDSIKALLCHEHFLKPYSEEHVLLKLLTRAF
jgi:hypothetical protein